MEVLRKEDDTFKGRVKEFCENTSAHAIGHTVGTGNKVKTTFWIIVFVAALTGCVFNIAYVFSSYLSYSFSVKSKNVFRPRLMKFPSVTVCNLNPISFSKQDKFIDEFRRNIGLSDQDCDNEFERPEMFRSPLLQIYRQAALPKHWFEYNENVTDMLGHSKRDFIVECLFEGWPGCENRFIVTKDPNLYNCYTFQPPEDYEATLLGLEMGLSFTLFLENTAQHYPSGVTGFKTNSYGYGDVGVKVVLHNSGTHPLPHSQGVIVEVGKTNNFVFRPVHTSAIVPPHPSPCNPLKTINSSTGNSFTYSQELCVINCYQNALAEKCGCVAMEDVPDKFGNDVPFCGAYPCNATKITENYQCFEKFLLSYLYEGDPNCDYCTKPCKEVKYETSTFQSKWPSTLQLPEVLNLLKTKPNNTIYNEILRNITSEEIPRFIENNFLRINVYFTDYHIRMDTETLDTDWFALFSNIGGAFGFWVGISIVTGFEILELILDVIIIAVNRWCLKKKNLAQSPKATSDTGVIGVNNSVFSRGS